MGFLDIKINKLKSVLLIVFMLSALTGFGQSKFEFDGLLMGFTNYSPRNDFKFWSGARYLPELSYEYKLDSIQSFTAEASGNFYGAVQYGGNQSTLWEGDITPYRIWARYLYRQSEIRVGLQKIDFGSSTLLRPMQWFNGIDPRDPLQLTNGVYATLARYYFKNNANIWLWVLYGNDERRGYDIMQSDKTTPEYGGRIQYPTPKGEIALSYHHRKSVLDMRSNPENPVYIETPENRLGLDGKWDVGVGVWFETTYTRTQQNVGILTNQSLTNVGLDYTFGIGSGLNMVAEHLVSVYGEEAGKSDFTGNTTATSFTYPIGFYDHITAFVYYDWASEGTGFFANYEHQFNRITTYLMLFYNPETEVPIQSNDLIQTTPGFGIRLMAVFHH